MKKDNKYYALMKRSQAANIALQKAITMGEAQQRTGISDKKVKSTFSNMAANRASLAQYGHNKTTTAQMANITRRMLTKLTKM